MIASNQSISARSASPLGSYVSIGKAGALLGVSVQSLRLWESKGLIKAYRTCGGHGQRRYLLSELKSQVLGTVEESAEEGRKVAVYVRVSSAAQQREGSLDRQLSRMLETVAQKEGIIREKIQVYRDVASAFGSRQGLNSMVDDLIGGKLSKVYVEHADRLSRVPALTRLLEHLAKKSGIQVVALDRDETVDEMKNAMLELVEFVTVLANRTNARKAAERRTKVLTPQTIDFIRREVAGGRSLRDIVERANQAGHRTEKGEEITFSVARRCLSKVVDKLLPVETHNSFAEFVAKHLKPRKESKVQAAAIHSGYKLWCRKHGVTPITPRKCGDWMRANKMKPQVRSGYVWYDAVEIVDYPSVVVAKGEWGTKFDNQVKS